MSDPRRGVMKSDLFERRGICDALAKYVGVARRTSLRHVGWASWSIQGHRGCGAGVGPQQRLRGLDRRRVSADVKAAYDAAH